MQLTDDTKLDHLSRHLDPVGYADHWLRKILDILKAEGVVDETPLRIAGLRSLYCR